MMPRVNTDAGDMRASAVWAAGPAASAESATGHLLVLFWILHMASEVTVCRG